MKPILSLLRAVLIVVVVAALAAALLGIVLLLILPPSPPFTPAATHGGAAPSATPTPAHPPASPAAAQPGDDNDPLGLPLARASLQVLHKEHFTIGYDERLKEPAWVSYTLSGPIRFHGHEHRPARFLPDPDLAVSPRSEDYARSGFDRGHLCPAYALFSRFGAAAMEQTFITTNICPQQHGLNAGRWEDLESLIAGREGGGGGWAASFGEVWVTDGPVQSDPPARLRAGEAIPSAFFMIVLRREADGHFRSLAVEMPNQLIVDPIERYLVSIASIERQTGLSFAPALAPDQQEALKAEPTHALW
jgi:endonuclease G